MINRHCYHHYRRCYFHHHLLLFLPLFGFLGRRPPLHKSLGQHQCGNIATLLSANAPFHCQCASAQGHYLLIVIIVIVIFDIIVIGNLLCNAMVAKVRSAGIRKSRTRSPLKRKRVKLVCGNCFVVTQIASFLLLLSLLLWSL